MVWLWGKGKISWGQEDPGPTSGGSEAECESGNLGCLGIQYSPRVWNNARNRLWDIQLTSWMKEWSVHTAHCSMRNSSTTPHSQQGRGGWTVVTSGLFPPPFSRELTQLVWISSYKTGWCQWLSFRGFSFLQGYFLTRKISLFHNRSIGSIQPEKWRALQRRGAPRTFSHGSSPVVPGLGPPLGVPCGFLAGTFFLLKITVYISPEWL